MKPYHDRYLEHYGVKGMKWGVRKDRPGGPGYNNSRGPAGKARKLSRKQKKLARQSSEHRVSRKILTKRLSEMSNAELSYVNQRLSLESNFKQVNPSVAKKGEKYAKRTLGVIGTATALYALQDNKMLRDLTAFGKKVVNSGKSFNPKDPLSIDRAIESINRKR